MSQKIDMTTGMALIAITVVLLAIYFVVSKKMTRRRFDRFLADVKSGKKKPREWDLTIYWDKDGFVFRNDKDVKKSDRMSWAEVKKVTAYKRDLFTVDLICLFFERADQSGVQVHEDSNRWMDFIEDLPNFLPGCLLTASWLHNVTVLAFKPNTTIIFNRGETQSGVPQC